MKILLDQGAPVPLRRELAGHAVSTAFERGWSELTNGQLLAAAGADRFGALITTDKNLGHQQNLAALKLAILVLPTTSWPVIRQHLPVVRAAVGSLRPGELRELTFP